MGFSASRCNGDVDVVLPLRCPAPWLDETLEGLAQQDFPNWNLICTVHDDSLELSHKVLDRFPKATIIPVSDNLTFPAVLNIGARSGTATYIARLDQDDVPFPGRLAKQVAFLEENQEVAVVATPVTDIDASGHALGTSFGFANQDIRKRLLIKNSIAHPSIMMRRSVFNAVAGYEEKAINGEDYELWLRIASVAAVACLEEPQLMYRRHDTQMSAVGFMNAEARSSVRRARLRLAQELRISRIQAEVIHALWTLPQIWRSWRRRALLTHGS